MEITVKEIWNILNEFAPFNYQESYDNSGLQVGDMNSIVKSCLIGLDCTENMINYAVSNDMNLIITHHPLIFSGIKSLTGKNDIERILIKAIQNNISVISIHTNLDKAREGVSYLLSKKLKLKNVELLNSEKGMLKKLVVFCPYDHADKVRKALFESGAGRIGNYADCSYNVKGEGTFKALEGANPFVGEKDIVHVESEVRIEMIFESHLQNSLVKVLLKEHPYEEVAYDIINLDNEHPYVGLGVVGDLDVAMEEHDFLTYLAKQIDVKCIRHNAFIGNKVKKIAICGGSGSSFIDKAIFKKADVFVTSDVKYHSFFESEHKMLIADIGHFESEQYTKELIFEIITKKIPNFAACIYNEEQNPVNYFVNQ